MLIYLIRHGQTDWNAEGRLQGQKDIGLNENGRRQASDNGRRLAEELGDSAVTFDYVASPLGRTRETMERVRAAMGLDPHGYRTDPRLIELSFGDWEGSTIPELQRVMPERVEARARHKWDFIPPGQDAESYEILAHRRRPTDRLRQPWRHRAQRVPHRRRLERRQGLRHERAAGPGSQDRP